MILHHAVTNQAVGPSTKRAPLAASATEPLPATTICSQTLSEDDTIEFTNAVKRHYWYELFIDDLPVWGFVGEVKPATASAAEQYLLYTHKQLDISYNNDRVSAAAKPSKCSLVCSKSSSMASVLHARA